jgi:hypothetical protein
MSQRIAHKIATAYAPPPEYDLSREIIPLLKERGELGFLLGDPVGRAGLVSRYSAPAIPLPKDEPGAREGRNAVIPDPANGSIRDRSRRLSRVLGGTHPISAAKKAALDRDR